MAEQMHCSLAEALERVDYDEYLLWEIYWHKDMEVPRRSDYYLMGVMAECRRPHVKDPSSVKLEQMLIKFTDKKPEQELTPQQKMQISKARWLMGVGIDPKKALATPAGQSYRGEPFRREIMRRKPRPNE